MILIRLLLLIVMLTPGPLAALQPDERLQDPVLESRARDISKSLRCLVCQNQSIDDSDAPLARDLRIVVRERLQQGDSDDQVVRYVTARYGDFVLLKPPFKPATWLLWFGPAAILLLGGAMLIAVHRRRGGATPPPLSDEERRRLADLLKDR